MKVIFFKNKNIPQFDEAIRSSLDSLEVDTGESNHFFEEFQKLQQAEEKKNKRKKYLWLCSFIFIIACIMLWLVVPTELNEHISKVIHEPSFTPSIEKTNHVTIPTVKQVNRTKKSKQNLQNKIVATETKKVKQVNELKSIQTIPGQTESAQDLKTGKIDATKKKEIEQHTDTLYIIW